jgi:Uma2 family endonuclease
MNETRLVSSPIIYPEADGQPMTESDITRDYLLYCIEVLRLFFQPRQDVYISGNLFVYYQEGNPKAVVSPDVFVVFGVSNQKRRSYKAWQEGGKLPAFILEITSFTTQKQDEVEKPKLYASLGVLEYFQYDPTADYLKSQLKGYQLVNGVYQPLPMEMTSDAVPLIHSSVLGLDLRLQTPAERGVAQTPRPKELRFYDPQTQLKLLSREELEQAKEQVQQERDLAQQERNLAQQRAEQLAARLRELGVDPEQV